MLVDGRLASGGSDNNIRLWDLATDSEVACFVGHDDAVTALCQLPDGRLASGSGHHLGAGDDYTVRLWNVATGAETARLKGHLGPITTLCVLPHNQIASGSEDNTIRIWDVVTAHEITRLEVDAAVNCLVAPPDGHLVAGDALGRLHWLEIVEWG